METHLSTDVDRQQYQINHVIPCIPIHLFDLETLVSNRVATQQIHPLLNTSSSSYLHKNDAIYRTWILQVKLFSKYWMV